MKAGVYIITNPKGKVYIGSSINLDNRRKSYSRLSCKKQPKIYNSLIKYGFDAHEFKVLIECEPENILKWERLYGEYYNSLDSLNCCLPNYGDIPAIKKPLTAAQKENLRNKNLGKKMSEETKNKISQKNKGRIVSKETLERMSTVKKGHIVSDDVRNKIRTKLTGYKHTDETKQKISLIHKGRKASEETKNKISDSRRGGDNPAAKLVLDLTTGIYYNSAVESAFALGIDKKKVTRMLNGYLKNKINFIYA
jgi:group I intron endonuclease